MSTMKQMHQIIGISSGLFEFVGGFTYAIAMYPIECATVLVGIFLLAMRRCK